MHTVPFCRSVGKTDRSMGKDVRGDDMGKLDFGMAMVLAKFTGKETNRPPEGKKREGLPKGNPPSRDDVEKRKHLFTHSWLKIPKKERILLPSDPSD